MRHLILKSLILALFAFIAACTAETLEPTELISVPTPTQHRLFMGESNAEPSSGDQVISAGVPTVAGIFRSASTPTATPFAVNKVTPTPPKPPPTPNLSQTDILTVTLFGDELHPDWEIVNDVGSGLNPLSTDATHSGRYALAFTPKQPFSTAMLAVKEDAGQVYRREDVLGFRFWITGGETEIYPSDFAVTVLGSNANPYWVVDDTSVTSTISPTFSETRLYYLGFNRSIPAGTWSEVEIWLDNLIYDPFYDYVTGLYIKNDEFFTGTLYIDDIEMIRLGGEDLSASENTLPTSGVPVESGESAETAETDSAGPTPGPALRTPFGPEGGFLIHVVEQGESFGVIASKYGTNLEVLQVVNSLFPGSSLQLEEVLVILPGVTDPSSVSPYQAIQLEEDGSISAIAQQYGVSEEELREINQLGPGDTLPAGRWLVVPG